MNRGVWFGLFLAAALFVAAASAQTSPNQPPPQQPQQPEVQRLPPVAPTPPRQSGLANRADPLIPVFIVWEEGFPPSGVPRGADRRSASGEDRDRDGARAEMDCDDNDRTRAPGVPEVADFDGHDEDCDPFTIGVRDQDKDGFTSWSATHVIRNAAGAAIAVLRGPDCDDLRRDVSPNSPEVLGDLRDNDCDGLIDVIERTGHQDYCAPAREVRASMAARSPCGQPRGDTEQWDRR
jgi:Putative metal-binding motif